MSQKPATWKKLDSEIVADCRVFDVRKSVFENSENGDQAPFFVVDNPDWVNVIGITSENEVVLIEQYRHGTEEVVLEVPGGLIDPGETPEQAALREFEEETGFKAGSISFLGRSHPNPAIQSNSIYHFVATDCRFTNRYGFDRHESIITRLVGVEEIGGIITNGQMTHSLAITAFHLFALKGGR